MDELVEQLVGSYPDINEGQPSSWVLLSTDRKRSSVHLNEICHAQLRYEGVGKWDEALLAVPKGDDQDLVYISWLINNPFKQWQDQITIKSDGSEDFYLHVTGLAEFPANAFMNFCIATRAPIEFPDTITLWTKLMDLGVHSNLAFVLAGLANKHIIPASLDVKLHCVGPPSAGHWWFNTGSDWDRLLAGNPGWLSKPYRARPNESTPTNSIWGDVAPKINVERINNHTIQELMEMFPQ